MMWLLWPFTETYAERLQVLLLLFFFLLKLNFVLYKNSPFCFFFRVKRAGKERKVNINHGKLNTCIWA